MEIYSIKCGTYLCIAIKLVDSYHNILITQHTYKQAPILNSLATLHYTITTHHLREEENPIIIKGNYN